MKKEKRDGRLFLAAKLKQVKADSNRACQANLFKVNLRSCRGHGR